MVRTQLHLELKRIRTEHRDTLLTGGTFLLFSLVLLGLAYAHPDLAFNLYLAAASLLFFVALYLLLSMGPIDAVLSEFFTYVRRPLGAAVFLLYLFVHYLLYGILLERLLIAIYGPQPTTATATAYLASYLYLPATPKNVLLSLLTGPSFTFVAPPDLGISLASFSLFFGFLISVLVVANVSVVVKARACPPLQRWSTLVVLPSVGVIVGASCCLSLPILLALVVPAASLVAYSAFTSYAAFFLFPIGAFVALLLNFRYSRVLIARTLQSTPGSEALGVF